MNPLKIKDIVLATEGKLLCGDPETEITAICTDTRKILPNSLFIPLVGERFDAHNFIPSALEGGSVASLTSKPEAVTLSASTPIVLVSDTRRALGNLAAYYRNQFNVTLFGITGSVGKTTVKELTYAALSEGFSTMKTEGNFNNEIGLPLTLFRLESNHQAAIIEMGMSDFGEIDRLAAIASPDFAMLTNIGHSHIEHLGSQENIYKAKSEILAHIKPSGKVIINGDDPILAAHQNEIANEVISVGTSPQNDLYATDITATATSVSFTAVYGSETVLITLQFPGEHNVVNALLACGAALCMGMSLEVAARGLSKYVPDNQRMQLINANGITVINDCYNAAPTSVSAALRVLCAQSGRKIAILGDIKELGSFAESAHRAIGKEAAELGIDAVFAFGENARWIAEEASPVHAEHFTDMDALTASLSTFIRSGDAVLVKASRAMRLERVTEFLQTLNK